MALLEVHRLTKRFGGLLALSNVDLTIDEGMIFSLIGPNGAGKTTFFHLLTGIYAPDQGEIQFLERSMADLRPDQITAAGMSRTFQNIRLFGGMTVIENVLVGMHSRLTSGVWEILFRNRQTGLKEADARRRAKDLLTLVGLAGREREWARHLSYGEQRRLEIARALASRPKLLLLDEPTAGMNPSEAASLMRLLKKLPGAYVRSILLIEHNMRVVMEISDRVAVLDYGEKIAEGNPSEVRNDPKVIEAYLGRGEWASHA